MRDPFLQGVKTIVQGNNVCLRKATINASSSNHNSIYAKKHINHGDILFGRE